MTNAQMCAMHRPPMSMEVKILIGIPLATKITGTHKNKYCHKVMQTDGVSCRLPFYTMFFNEQAIHKLVSTDTPTMTSKEWLGGVP